MYRQKLLESFQNKVVILKYFQMNQGMFLKYFKDSWVAAKYFKETLASFRSGIHLKMLHRYWSL